MSVLDFLSGLRERGIIVSLNPGDKQLKISAPKGAIDTPTRDELTARKQEIIRFLGEAVQRQADAAPSISVADPAMPSVLTRAQDRVWRLHQMSPNSATLNIAVAWELRGDVDLDMVEEALQVVADRHDPLRCVFPARDRQPTVVVRESASLPVQRMHVAGSGDKSTLTEATDLAESFAALAFDLSKSVGRAAAIKVTETHHLLVLVFHQIAFDWGAATPLVRELSAVYDSLRRGEAPELDPIEIGYLDFASWQQGWLEGPVAVAQGEYWRKKLESAYRPLALPGRTAAAVDDNTSGIHHFQFSDAEARELKALSQSAGATLYMTLLGAWQALLAAYGDSGEAIVFTLLGLNRPELKKLVGLFSNPLPIRVDLAGDPTPEELLSRVRESALGAYSHQDLPLEQVIEHLRLDTDAPQIGLFQSLFIFQHEPTPTLQLGDTTAELLTIGRHADAFDLRLFAEDTGDGIRCWLEYDTDLFTSEVTERLVDQYRRLLEVMPSEPNAALSTLVPVTDEDRAAATASDPDSPPMAYAAPQTELEIELVELWSGIFGRDVGIDDDFFALGGHSLMAVSLFTEIEARLDRALPLATLFEAPNIRALAGVLGQDDWQLQWTSLVPIKPGGSRPPVFCVAALGDEIIQFGELADLLPEDQPFYGLQQGLDRTDEIRTTIPEIATHYINEIRAVQPRGPHVIAGYCFGGLIAYEMAQQLAQMGDPVGALLLIESELPGGIYLAQSSPGQRLRRALSLTRHAGPAAAARQVRKRLSKLWRWTIWTRLRHQLHRSFDRIGVALPEVLKDILQINAKAADDYTPGMDRYSGDISLLRAELLTPGFLYKDLLGWDELVDGQIEIHWLPGDHEGIWKAPNVQVYAKILEQILDEAAPGYINNHVTET
jgi:thioesterase domain-containing protein/acyl carrier protein